MIKDIVVNLGLGANDPAGDYAVSMGEAFGAHVLGVAVSYEPVIPGTVMGGIPPEIIESQRAELNKKARAAIARFEQAAKRAGISMETRTISASISGAADQIGHIGRRFDLIVVGQPGRKDLAPRRGDRRRRAVRIRPPRDFRAIHTERWHEARSHYGMLGRQPRRYSRNR